MWNPKHPMNDSTRFKNCQNRFSTVPSPNSLIRTTPAEINSSHNCTKQYGIPCLFSGVNSQLQRTNHLQCHAFPVSVSRSELQPQPFHQPTTHFVPTNRMHSEQRTVVTGKDTLNFKTQIYRFQQKANSLPQRQCHRSTSADIAMATKHYPPKICPTCYPASEVPIRSIHHPSCNKYFFHRHGDSLEEVDLPSRPTWTMTCDQKVSSDQVRRFHDSFHKMNSTHKCRSSKKLYSTDQKQDQVVKTSNTVRTHYLTDNQTSEAAIPSFENKNGEENRICDILKEAINEGRHILNRNGTCNSTAHNGDDQIVLKPIFNWIECRGRTVKNIERLNEKLTKVTHGNGGIDDSDKLQIATTTRSIEVKDKAWSDQNLNQSGDDHLVSLLSNDLLLSNDNNNNIAVKDETLFSSLEDCDDDSFFEMSDDSIQALLMPFVINFLSDE